MPASDPSCQAVTDPTVYLAAPGRTRYHLQAHCRTLRTAREITECLYSSLPDDLPACGICSIRKRKRVRDPFRGLGVRDLTVGEAAKVYLASRKGSTYHLSGDCVALSRSRATVEWVSSRLTDQVLCKFCAKNNARLHKRRRLLPAEGVTFEATTEEDAPTEEYFWTTAGRLEMCSAASLVVLSGSTWEPEEQEERPRPWWRPGWSAVLSEIKLFGNLPGRKKKL